jgi:hypothetical protein
VSRSPGHMRVWPAPIYLYTQTHTRTVTKRGKIRMYADRTSRSSGTLQFSHPRVDVNLFYLLRSTFVPQPVGEGVINISQFYYTPNVCSHAIQSVQSGGF